jgi:hypothetical protein
MLALKIRFPIPPKGKMDVKESTLHKTESIDEKSHSLTRDREAIRGSSQEENIEILCSASKTRLEDERH